MSAAAPTTEIEVVVAEELKRLAAPERAPEIEQLIVDGASDVLQRLGIPQRTVARVRARGQTRAVRVVVNGVFQPYPPSLLTRVWHTTAPYDLHSAPLDGPSPGNGFGDEWLRSAKTTLGSGTATYRALSRFLSELAIAVIREQPQCALSDAHVATIVGEASRAGGSSARLLRSDLADVVRFLIPLGVSVADRAELREALADTAVLDLPSEDRNEVVFERLRPPRIAIHVPRDYLVSLGATPRHGISVYDEALDPVLHEPFRDLERNVFLTLGLGLPKLVWVRDDTLDPETAAVVVNDVRSLPARIPAPDQLWVDVSAEALPANVQGRRSYLPSSGTQAAIVSASHRKDLERRKIPFLTSAEAVAAIVSAEIERRAPTLLAVEDVTYQLSVLWAPFPKLVEAAMAAFSLGNLARVLRGLLAEGQSIRDLRLLLDRLLDYEGVPVDNPSEVVLDRRLAVPRRRATESPDCDLLLAFARVGLADDLAARYADDHGRLDVLELDPGVEKAHEAIPNGAAFDPELAESLREAVWAKLPRDDAARRSPVVLTGTHARRAMRDALASELPSLGVLARAELKPGLKLKRLGNITTKDIQVQPR
jgi:FHIPEP family